MTELTREQLVAEVEDVIRCRPTPVDFMEGKPSSIDWLGRASAVIDAWSMPVGIHARAAMMQATNNRMVDLGPALDRMMALLAQARADLRMRIGKSGVVVQEGMVYDYFEEVRQTISLAQREVFFVDPYLEADFVSRYLVHIPAKCHIRLLAKYKLPALLSAVEVFVAQNGHNVLVRSIESLHDRFVFVDRTACYQSGASFKDGAKKSPTLVSQIIDAFPAMLATYEDKWNNARVER